MVFKSFLTAVIVALIAIGFLAFKATQFMASRTGTSEENIIFEVQKGQSFYFVTRRLSETGLITDENKFRWLGRITGYSAEIRAGEYLLDKGMRPLEILEEISSGQSIERPITIQEGLNIYEIANLLEKRNLGKAKTFLTLAKDRVFIQDLLGQGLSSLEGYLYPETYNMTKFTSERTLIKTMVENFKKTFSEIEKESARDFSTSRHAIVTLASIIEKETGAPFERPMISSVFHNRIQKGMRLQSDPTIIYGQLDVNNVFLSNIRKSDIVAPTKYNTYTVKGLPYGPISNPGREALKATISPAKSSFFYFVSKNDGTHVFSETYEQHLKAVRAYQLDRAARQGKSWRDLNTKAQ